MGSLLLKATFSGLPSVSLPLCFVTSIGWLIQPTYRSCKRTYPLTIHPSGFIKSDLAPRSPRIGPTLRSSQDRQERDTPSERRVGLARRRYGWVDYSHTTQQAFSLPGNRIHIFTAWIALCDKPDRDHTMRHTYNMSHQCSHILNVSSNTFSLWFTTNCTRSSISASRSAFACSRDTVLFKTYSKMMSTSSCGSC